MTTVSWVKLRQACWNSGLASATPGLDMRCMLLMHNTFHDAYHAECMQTKGPLSGELVSINRAGALF